MSDLTQTVETLLRRVEALEAENARLRRQAAPQLPSPEHSASRRQLLLGAAGMAGVLAGGAALAHAQPASAASASASAQAASTRKEQTLCITLTPLTSHGVYWTQHEWSLGAHFTGDRAPVVIATAIDDHMEHDVTSNCTCSVRVQGKPGAYMAVIHVRGIHKYARSVEVTALAIDA